VSNTLVSMISMGVLGIGLSIALVIASKKFAVESDPRVDDLEGVLPGANCGACGYAGCRSFAEALATGEAPTNGCPVGGASVAELVAKILGVSNSGFSRNVAQVLCKGGCAEASQRADYDGPQDCRIAHMTQGGDKGCTYGCLGCGTCVAACNFDAMAMNENGLPMIFEDNCTACGACVAACPRDIIILTGEEYGVHIRCRSHASGREARQVCIVGCIACRRCEKVCPTGAITVENNLAEINYDKCIVCRKCVEVCPVNTIEWQEGKGPVRQKVGA